MKVVPMKAEQRTAIGRNQVAHIRKEGWLPAVIYGDKKENVHIRISEWELDQHVRAHHKVFALDVAGTEQAAYLQEVTFHTLTDRPLHADFKRIDLKKPIETEIEVTLVGHPVGLAKGGVLVKGDIVLEIRCLPTAIPELIELDVSGLEIDDSMTASQVKLPEGVELMSDPEMSICHVEEIVEEAPAEPVEGAEGEEAPADGEAEGKEGKKDE